MRRGPPKTRIDGQCSDCGKSEPEVKFHLQKRNGGYDKHVYCIECQNRRTAYNYRQRKGEINAKSKMRRDAHKTELIQLLGGQCEDCGIVPGEEWPVRCFDFHHVDGKDFNFASHLGKEWSRALLLEEIKHCALLCSNCHRRRHARVEMYHRPKGRPPKYPNVMAPPTHLGTPQRIARNIDKLVRENLRDITAEVLEKRRAERAERRANETAAMIEEIRALGLSSTEYDRRRAAGTLDPKFKDRWTYPQLYGMTYAEIRGPLPKPVKEPPPPKPPKIKPPTVREKILGHLAAHPRSNIAQVTEGIGHSNQGTVGELLSRLKAGGVVARDGSVWSVLAPLEVLLADPQLFQLTRSTATARSFAGSHACKHP